MVLSLLWWSLWVIGIVSGIWATLGGADKAMAHAVDAASYFCERNTIFWWTWAHTCEAVQAKGDSAGMPSPNPFHGANAPISSFIRGPSALTATNSKTNEADSSAYGFKDLASYRVAVEKTIYEVEGAPLQVSESARVSSALREVADAAEHAGMFENLAKSRETAMIDFIQTPQTHVADIINNCQGVRAWFGHFWSKSCRSPIAKDEKRQTALLLTSVSNHTRELSTVLGDFEVSIDLALEASSSARSTIAQAARSQRAKFQWSSQWSKYYFPGGRERNEMHRNGLAVLEDAENVLARGHIYLVQIKDENRLLISEVPEMERELTKHAEGPYFPAELSEAVDRKLDRILASVKA